MDTWLRHSVLSHRCPLVSKMDTNVLKRDVGVHRFATYLSTKIVIAIYFVTIINLVYSWKTEVKRKIAILALEQ